MSGLKKAAGELGAKAAFAAAKDAAERALDDALMTEQELAARKAQQAERAKRRRTRRLVLAALGVLIVLGAIGLALRYWYWFLVLGMLGLAALYARHRWRKYRAGRRQPVAELRTKPEPGRKQVLELPERRPAPVAPAQPPGPSVEDELAALKARIKN